MPLYITNDKINEIDTEVVVCPYGIDDQAFKSVQDEIYQLAGYDRLNRSVKQKKADTSVFMTPSYDLNKDYICHVLFGNKSILHYYKKCIEISLDHQCNKIAFPVYDVSEIDKLVVFFGECLEKNDITIYLYTDLDINPVKLNRELDSYLNEQYLIHQQNRKMEVQQEKSVISGVDMLRLYSTNSMVVAESKNSYFDDDTFYERLNRLIDAKEYSDSRVSKRANLLLKDYLSIMDDENFKPRMHTTLAFAISLKLTMEQTNDLLKRAGYSFNKKSKLYFLFDYFYKNDCYNIHLINLYLFAYHFKTLGI